MGFAPTTSSLARKRSTAELHPHKQKYTLYLDFWQDLWYIVKIAKEAELQGKRIDKKAVTA